MNNNEKLKLYHSFITEYGFAVLRFVYECATQPFNTKKQCDSIRYDIGYEIADLADSICDLDEVENMYKKGIIKRFEPYINLYMAINAAIELTADAATGKHKDLYPAIIRETYGAFQNKITKAFFYNENDKKVYFRDILPSKRSDVRNRAMNLLFAIIDNNGGEIIDYDFYADETINLIKHIMDCIKSCTKSKVTEDDDKKNKKRTLEKDDTEIRRATRRIYRQAIMRLSEFGYDCAFREVLQNLDIETNQKTHWDSTLLSCNLTKENGIVTVAYKKDDAYVSDIVLYINDHKIRAIKNKQNELTISEEKLKNHYGIHKIESVEVTGFRNYDDRYLALQASKTIIGSRKGMLAMLTNPNQNLAADVLKVSLVLAHSLNVLASINPDLYKDIYGVLTYSARAEAKYAKLWVLGTYLCLLDETHEIFALYKEKEPEEKNNMPKDKGGK